MVDVGDKPISRRLAVAAGRVIMRAETLTLIEQGLHHKGDVVGTARLAGIMAAKRTADLIPLCHALALDVVDLDVRLDPHGPAVDIRATCAVNGRTGVEMEALTAVSIAALTIYDMCKAVDRTMRVTDIRLLRKEGGRSGPFSAT
jgi:cyclic pyranopterin phosphate synthase